MISAHLRDVFFHAFDKLVRFARTSTFFMLVFLFYHLVYGLPFKPEFLASMLYFSLAYTAVYFINDYSDSEFDLKYKSCKNLYYTSTNKSAYWISFLIIASLGIGFSCIIEPISVIALLIIYLSMVLYSIKPLRLKERKYLRGLSLGVIYSLKVIYASLLLGFSLAQIPLLFLFCITFLFALGDYIYKRYYYGGSYNMEKGEFYLFGAFSLLVIILYLDVFIKLIPLLLGVAGYLIIFSPLYFFFTKKLKAK